MSEITPAYVKALFHHLVRQIGGLEAAGAYLGVSFQRVSQLQSVNCPDMPTVIQVATLEAALGHSVIFGALAKLVEDGAGSAAKDALEEACEVTEAAANLLHLVRSGNATPREIQAAVLDVQREAMDVPRAVRRVV